MNGREPSSYVTCAGEGTLDHVVIARVIEHLGAGVGPIHGGNGKPALLKALNGYNAAAQFSPWLVLVDLDQSADCAPEAKQNWLAEPNPRMCFRIAVRAVEAWLLADRERIARFLGISIGTIPTEPDQIDDPKEMIVNLARRSNRSDIRNDLVPREGSGRKVGPAYTSRLIEFIETHESRWRPEVAAQASDSFSRCLNCVTGLVGVGE